MREIFSVSSSIALLARASPPCACDSSSLLSASALLMRSSFPPRLTVTVWPRTSRNTDARLRWPLGRPRGLPDCPLRNRPASGGRLYPTSLSVSWRLVAAIGWSIIAKVPGYWMHPHSYAVEQVRSFFNAQLRIFPVVGGHYHHTRETRRARHSFDKFGLTQQL